jgi:hypothetical protein
VGSVSLRLSLLRSTYGGRNYHDAAVSVSSMPIHVHQVREAADYRATATRLEHLACGMQDEAVRGQLMATARVLREIADAIHAPHKAQPAASLSN